MTTDTRRKSAEVKNEYELLHQFEVIFLDGEYKTRAATRDYQQVWKNVIDNTPEEGVTPVFVYRMNGEVCAAAAGTDDLIDNTECAMEIFRLATRVRALESKHTEIDALREEIARRDELMVRDLAELRSQRTEIAALREAVKDFLCECALVDKFRRYETWQITPWSMDELMKMVEEEP